MLASSFVVDLIVQLNNEMGPMIIVITGLIFLWNQINERVVNSLETKLPSIKLMEKIIKFFLGDGPRLPNELSAKTIWT